jgi:hypothetical protein
MSDDTNITSISPVEAIRRRPEKYRPNGVNLRDYLVIEAL